MTGIRKTARAPPFVYRPNNVANQDGIVFFPGSVPLYKTVNGIQVMVAASA